MRQETDYLIETQQVLIITCLVTQEKQTTFKMKTAFFCVITQQVVVNSYQHFGTTYLSIGCSKTSVRNYHYSLHNNPEQRSSHLLRGKSLKSHITFKMLTAVTYIVTSCFGPILKYKHKHII